MPEFIPKKVKKLLKKTMPHLPEKLCSEIKEVLEDDDHKRFMKKQADKIYQRNWERGLRKHGWS